MGHCFLLRCMVVTLFLQFCKGFQVKGSTQPIAALVGEDVILPCHLEPQTNAVAMTIEWSRPDLHPGYVHIHRKGHELTDKKNPSYLGRTALFIENMKTGNISLKLSRVKLSDEGSYTCSTPTFSLVRQAQIQLSVEEPKLVCSHVSAKVGEDVVLPCKVIPPKDVADLTVEWSRPDLSPEIVHLRRNSKKDTEGQNKLYESRTALFPDGLKHGNISLKLSKVTHDDQANYTCKVVHYNKELVIKLTVYIVFEAKITNLGPKDGGVVLQCEARSQGSEPVVKWMEKEGPEILNSDPEIILDPDGLYNVTSKVTVHQTASNTFICSVESREKEITVPVADFKGQTGGNPDDGSNTTGNNNLGLGLGLGLPVLLGGIYFYKKKRRVNTQNGNDMELVKIPDAQNETQNPLIGDQDDATTR